MEHFSILFQELLANFSCAFSTPTRYSLFAITLGWILCSAKRTMTGIIRAAGTHAPKSHDAYQGFFSKAKWDMETLWELLGGILCNLSPKDKPILLVGDDSLIKHSGRKIWGAGLYRDAVRSSKKYPPYAWGLNWVVLDHCHGTTLPPRTSTGTAHYGPSESQGPSLKAKRTGKCKKAYHRLPDE